MTAPLDGVVLDHVAHAVARWQDAWGRYAVDLGATWSSGGEGPGFAPAQLSWANDARLEVLMPWDTGVNDFLARFLAHSGPGPHHLTYKVPDLRAAVDDARRSGWDPVGIDLSHPEWMEAFLHPKQATGIVVQLAQAPEAWTNGPPADFPRQRRQRRDGSGPVPAASLRWVVHAVADVDVGLALFAGLLGGTVTGDVDRGDRRWADLRWAGPLGLRLAGPTRGRSPGGELEAWLAGRPGRLHHLEVETVEPDTVPDAAPAAAGASALVDGPAGTGAYVVAPADNRGLRLALRPPPADPSHPGATGAATGAR